MDDTPLGRVVQNHIKKNWDRYHTPGHVNGAGAPQELQGLLGEQVFKSDLTELPDLDDLHTPKGAIKQSQHKLAKIFGADSTYYLVNGSTAGVVTMIMSVAGPGEKILIPRNAHKSVYNGLILSGAEPVYLPVSTDTDVSLSYNVKIDDIESIVNKYSNYNIKGVLITSPSYHGICLDPGSLREKLTCPLLIDEAHGSHLIFSDELPPSAGEYGGDMWVHSTHKTLGTLTQSSLLHINENKVNVDNVSFMLQLMQTTSPSYPLMLSLDGLIAYKEKFYKYWDQLVKKKLPWLRQQIADIPGLQLLTQEELMCTGFNLDHTKVTLKLSQVKFTGYDLSDYLRLEHNIQVEQVERKTILLLITPFHSEKQLNYLVYALEQAIKNQKKLIQNRHINETRIVRKMGQELSNMISPEVKISPREAVYRQGRYVILSNSVGKVAQEFVIPYPPGIPVLVPGEVITTELKQYISYLLDCPDIHLQGLEYGDKGYIKILS